MNIVCLFLSFNGIGEARGMYGDLVCEMASRGHNVYVIAASRNKEDRIEENGKIIIYWVKSLSLLNVGFVKKAFANLMLPYLFIKASKKYLPKAIDLIVSPTPPITLTNVIGKLKKKSSAKFYLILRDIFPQNAVDLGLLSSKSAIYKYFRRMEMKLYGMADKIGCMSQGNVEYLLKHNPAVEPQKAEMLPNWIDVNKVISSCHSSLFADYGLEKKFVAIFGGNLGIAQNPKNIIDLAETHKDKTDLVFLIIGRGIYKKKIETAISNKHLSNVILIDHLPRDEYESLASRCDVGLVSLNGAFTIPNIPSRTLGYWQAYLPVFAIVDKNTDLGTNIIDKYNGGLWCLEGDKDKYYSQFNILYSNRSLAKQMGRNGHNALCEDFCVSKAVDIILGTK